MTSPDLSVVLLATGPERLVTATLETVLGQTAPIAEVLVCAPEGAGRLHHRWKALADRHPIRWVEAGTEAPGATRNAALRASHGSSIVFLDGSEGLPSDYFARASAALAAAPGAAYAAAPGAYAPCPRPGTLDQSLLLSGAWSVAAPVFRRAATEHTGGFDEQLPDLVQWDLLLTLLELGETGVLLSGLEVVRPHADDVRLRESLRAERHLPSVRRILDRHERLFEQHAAGVLVERERIARTLWAEERARLDRRDRAQTELAATMNELAAVQAELRQHGLSTLEWADLRRTTPLSRNWGLDRGRPVDRYYIEAFVAAHAADLQGRVLEMLDAGLTTAFGGSRVDRADVLDIDPANDRATVVADLRAAHDVASDTYDCFILTQTLHLIDDMPAALAHAHRILKPGGVLLATLPCSSMVAEEYGAGGDHWRVTEAGARHLFERHFPAGHLEIRARGNVLATTAFLYGLACDELRPEELSFDDPAYPLIVTVRAVKSGHRATTVPLRPVPRAAVLLYHRVAAPPHDRYGMAVSPDVFRSELEHLCRAWRPMSLAALTEAALTGDIPDRAIALTFDDGYLDNLEVAAPILSEFGVPATFFLTSEGLDASHRYWWDRLEAAFLAELPPALTVEFEGTRRVFDLEGDAARRAAHDELYAVLKRSLPVVRDDVLWQIERVVPAEGATGDPRPLVEAEVRQLAGVPEVEIGAHGVHHVALRNLSPEHLFREVSECRTALERVVARPLTAFAYPFGDVSPEGVEMVRASGYRVAFTCEERGLRAGDHPLRLPRIGAPASAAALVARLAAL